MAVRKEEVVAEGEVAVRAGVVGVAGEVAEVEMEVAGVVVREIVSASAEVMGGAWVATLEAVKVEAVEAPAVKVKSGDKVAGEKERSATACIADTPNSCHTQQAAPRLWPRSPGRMCTQQACRCSQWAARASEAGRRTARCWVRLTPWPVAQQMGRLKALPTAPPMARQTVQRSVTPSGRRWALRNAQH